MQVKRFGRPSLKTPRVEQIILGRLVQGRSLQKILRSKHLPSYSTVTRWLETDEDFRNKYAKARQTQAHTLSEALIDIADEANSETVNVARLRIDTRKWVASKLLPKVYGEKSGDLHITSTTNNFVVLTADRLKQLQERHREALQ